MRKFALLLATAAVSTSLFALPAPASASCSVYDEELGCVDNKVCGAAGTVVEKVLRRELDCIQ